MGCNCGTNLAIGGLQRSSPLPVGDYWFDLIDVQNHHDAFAEWRFKSGNDVAIVATEDFPAVSWPDCPITEGECSPPRSWIKFSVVRPVAWDAVALGGFPNIIGPGEKIETSADTASNPDFSDYCDIGCQAEKVAIAASVVIGGTILVILAAKAA